MEDHIPKTIYRQNELCFIFVKTNKQKPEKETENWVGMEEGWFWEELGEDCDQHTFNEIL